MIGSERNNPHYQRYRLTKTGEEEEGEVDITSIGRKKKARWVVGALLDGREKASAALVIPQEREKELVRRQQPKQQNPKLSPGPSLSSASSTQPTRSSVQAKEYHSLSKSQIVDAIRMGIRMKRPKKKPIQRNITLGEYAMQYKFHLLHDELIDNKEMCAEYDDQFLAIFPQASNVSVGDAFEQIRSMDDYVKNHVKPISDDKLEIGRDAYNDWLALVNLQRNEAEKNLDSLLYAYPFSHTELLSVCQSCGVYLPEYVIVPDLVVSMMLQDQSAPDAMKSLKIQFLRKCFTNYQNMYNSYLKSTQRNPLFLAHYIKYSFLLLVRLLSLARNDDTVTNSTDDRSFIKEIVSFMMDLIINALHNLNGKLNIEQLRSLFILLLITYEVSLTDEENQEFGTQLEAELSKRQKLEVSNAYDLHIGAPKALDSILNFIQKLVSCFMLLKTMADMTDMVNGGEATWDIYYDPKYYSSCFMFLTLIFGARNVATKGSNVINRVLSMGGFRTNFFLFQDYNATNEKIKDGTLKLSCPQLWILQKKERKQCVRVFFRTRELKDYKRQYISDLDHYDLYSLKDYNLQIMHHSEINETANNDIKDKLMSKIFDATYHKRLETLQNTHTYRSKFDSIFTIIREEYRTQRNLAISLITNRDDTDQKKRIESAWEKLEKESLNSASDQDDKTREIKRRFFNNQTTPLKKSYFDAIRYAVKTIKDDEQWEEEDAQTIYNHIITNLWKVIEVPYKVEDDSEISVYYIHESNIVQICIYFALKKIDRSGLTEEQIRIKEKDEKEIIEHFKTFFFKSR
jgi:hypothetical protein